MENLMNEAIENTKQNMESRLKKIEEYNIEKDIKLKITLNNLENDIVKDFENKVKEASSNGYDFVNIYGYDNKDTFEEMKLNFLLKGPLMDRRGEGNRYDFFYNKEIIPVMERIKTKLSPFNIYLRFDRSQRKNFITASWKQKTT